MHHWLHHLTAETNQHIAHKTSYLTSMPNFSSILISVQYILYFTVYFLPPLVVYKICCDGFCFYLSENLPIPRIGLVCRKCLIKIDIARMPDFSSECISTQSSCIFHTHCTYYLLSHYTCLSVLEGLADSYIFRSEFLMLFM